MPLTTTMPRLARTTLALAALGALTALVGTTAGCAAASPSTATSSTATSSTPAMADVPSAMHSPPASASGDASGAGSAGTPDAQSSAGDTASPGGAPRCKAHDLQVSVQFDDAGMSHQYGYVRFLNAGSIACALGGHPGVSLVAGDDGHQIGQAAQPTGTVATTVVASGGRASAPLSLAQADAYDASTCQPTPVRGFRIYPPGSTASVFVAADGITGCASPSLSLLTVGPAQLGAGS